MITFVSATIGEGFLGGLLIGYALKKVVKLIAVIVLKYSQGCCLVLGVSNTLI